MVPGRLSITLFRSMTFSNNRMSPNVGGSLFTRLLLMFNDFKLVIDGRLRERGKEREREKERKREEKKTGAKKNEKDTRQ